MLATTPSPSAQQRQPAPVESLAEIDARRLDSYESWLDSNQARRGQLTPAEIKARERKTDEKQPNRKSGRPDCRSGYCKVNKQGAFHPVHGEAAQHAQAHAD